MAGPRSPNGRGRRLKPAPAWVRIPSGALYWIASLAKLAVSNGSLRSLRCSPGSRRLRRIRRNACVGELALFSTRFVGSSCRSAARTSRARIALGSRRHRCRSGTKSVSPRSASARRRAIRDWIASLAKLAVSNGSLRSLRCSPGSRRLRRIRRNACVGELALFSTRFVGSSCRSAARTSRARIALGSRRHRCRSGTKSVSPRSASARRRAIRDWIASLTGARFAL
jgi:hypothetical protein